MTSHADIGDLTAVPYIVANKLLVILKEIKVNKGNIISDKGLCLALTKEMARHEYMFERSQIVPIFRQLCRIWPKYSGDSTYPVPAASRLKSARRAYMQAGSMEMWHESYPYARLRWELVDFCIDKLEALYE